MRLVLEVASEKFEHFAEKDVIVASVQEVEIRQDDGLLSVVRRLLLIEGLGGAVLKEHGLDQGPAMRAFLAPREEDDSHESNDDRGGTARARRSAGKKAG